MKLKFFLLIAISSFLLHCNKNDANEKHITLFLDTNNSRWIDEHFLIDSIKIEHDDSLKIIFYTGDYQYFRSYYKSINGIYEIRERFDEEMKYFGVDTILTLYKSDTTFIFHSEFDFIPIVFYYAFTDSKYSIISKNDIYKSIKQSLVDTTYKEIFFYDEDYNIYKFINTWQDNECVYVKKK